MKLWSGYLSMVMLMYHKIMDGWILVVRSQSRKIFKLLFLNTIFKVLDNFKEKHNNKVYTGMTPIRFYGSVDQNKEVERFLNVWKLWILQYKIGFEKLWRHNCYSILCMTLFSCNFTTYWKVLLRSPSKLQGFPVTRWHSVLFK